MRRSRPMMPRPPRRGVAALALGIALVPMAGVALGAGSAEIRKDFDVDGVLVPCAYSSPELDAARAAADPQDSAYVAALGAAKPCAVDSAAAVRAADAFGGVRLIAVHAAGHADREWVRLRNVGGGTRRIAAAKLSSYQLRMSTGRTRIVQLDDVGVVARSGQTITIRFRCAARASRPKQVGGTVYLCLDRGRGGGEPAGTDVLAGGGAVVSLTVDGTPLTRLGYGARKTASGF
jgi:hypothetical protein